MTQKFIKLVLDLTTFDEDEFASEMGTYIEQGFEFKSMAELGDTEDNRVRLYELNKLCSNDIPGRGEFFTYEEFRTRRYGKHYDPKGAIIGIKQDEWIGMCATSNHSDEGFCFNEMTGVIRLYRRQGCAMALKLVGIRYAQQLGVQKIFTIQDTQNTSAIAMNRKLGYVDAR